MNWGWENFDEPKIDECQCVHFIILIVILIACAAILAISTYL